MKKLFILLLTLSFIMCGQNDQKFSIEITSMTKDSATLSIKSGISGTAYGMVEPATGEPPDSETLKQSEAKVEIEAGEKTELKIDLVNFSFMIGEEYKAYVMFVGQTTGEGSVLSKKFTFEDGNENKNKDENTCLDDGDNTFECATTLSVDEPFHSNIATKTDVDYYVFQAAGVGVYTFLIYDQGVNICSLDSTLILYASDGEKVLSSNDNSSTVGGPVPDPCSAINGEFNLLGKYYLRVASNPAGTPSAGRYTILILPPYIPYPEGISSHWKLDQSDSIVDELQSSNPVLRGELNSVEGIFGNALSSFSGENYITLPTSSFHGNQYFIFETWIKTTLNNDLPQYIVHHLFGSDRSSCNTIKGWYLRVDDGGSGGGEIRYAVGPGYTCSNFSYLSNISIADNEWHYIVLAKINTTSPTKIRLYIDGIHRSEADSTTDSISFPSSGVRGPRIGGGLSDSNYAISGSLDDIVYWNNPPKTWSEVDRIVANRWGNGNPKYYNKK